MIQADTGGQGIAQVALADLPAGVIGPGQLPAILAGHIAVDSEAARASARMIFLPDVRVEDIPDLILVVIGHKQGAVPDGDVTWHAESLSTKRFRGFNDRAGPKVRNRWPSTVLLSTNRRVVFND